MEAIQFHNAFISAYIPMAFKPIRLRAQIICTKLNIRRQSIVEAQNNMEVVVHLLIDHIPDICINTFDRTIHKGRDAAELHRMLSAWGKVAAKLKAGEITKEEYDRWRYRYPELDTSGQWHKITPSQGLSDMLVESLKSDVKE